MECLKKPDDVVFSNDAIVFVNSVSDNITFFSDNMGLVNVDRNNIGLHGDNFDDIETIMHFRLLAWCNRCNQRKAFKKR